jgi:hypothetical protein
MISVAEFALAERVWSVIRDYNDPSLMRYKKDVECEFMKLSAMACSAPSSLHRDDEPTQNNVWASLGITCFVFSAMEFFLRIRKDRPFTNGERDIGNSLMVLLDHAKSIQGRHRGAG